MSEPVDIYTLTKLKHDFEKLGVRPGMTLLVHTSLKSVGEVCGGPVAVILALEELLTEKGTLVMPTFNTNLTDPAKWTAPPVKQSQIQSVLDEMPPFDVEFTPTRGMGCVSETFRTQTGVTRSPHPHLSVAAWGKHAKHLCEEHPLKYGLGEESPLARMYELGGYVLLLGVGHDNNTSMHLAEYDSRKNESRLVQKAPMIVDGTRRWVEFDEIDLDNSDFTEIGESFEAHTEEVHVGRVGNAVARFMPQVSLVDYAKNYMSQQAAEN